MLVVAAAIVDKGELLAARRISPRDLAGKFEFPGGKVEEGEDPRSALAREIMEELGVEVDVAVEPFYIHKEQRGFKRSQLMVYQATLIGTRPLRSSDHDVLIWLQRKFWVNGVDWIAADRDAVIKLTELNPE